MTEMLHIFLSSRPGAVRPGTTGVAVPGYDPRILDDEGNDVAPGIPGMLFLPGDSTATGAAGECGEEERVVLVAA
jgi:acyl-coenzyme A synthetase/AMP-(fatty) acid ligase